MPDETLLFPLNEGASTVTMNIEKSLKVELVSVVDREKLVAEIWLGRELLAEIRHEDGTVLVQVYATHSGEPWELSYNAFLAALQLAREKLGHPTA